jgi:hypothetical protein
LKLCPFNLVLSQAKYFYNYFSFLSIKILVWRFLIEAQNFQFTTRCSTCSEGHVGLLDKLGCSS